MNILGISAFYHDSAACLIANGEVVAAASEERFTRVKHDSSFPRNAAAFALSRLNGTLDAIAFYDDFYLKRERAAQSAIDFGFSDNLANSVGNWNKFDDFVAEVRRLTGWSDGELDRRVHFVQHHLSHAASAYFCAPFAEAAVLTVDGVGEYATTTIGHGLGSQLKLLDQIDFPHSLGLFYSAMTHYLGFRVNSGEYKLMGLAPLGRPTLTDRILDKLLHLHADGSFSINLAYFRYHRSMEMADHRKLEALLGVAPRTEQDPIEQAHMDLGASVQAALETALFALARRAVERTGSRNLCLAGGVALNCSALGKLRNLDVCDQIYVQPAAGDAGGALGAALYLASASAQESNKRSPRPFSVYLGPDIDSDAAREEFSGRGFPHQALDDDALVDAVARALAEGKYVGWCRGPMEWGPRALGSRSILASPLVPGIQKHLNLRIKKRESFRPFAPAVLEECLGDLFIHPVDAPTMSFVFFLRDELRSDTANWTWSIPGRALNADQARAVKEAVIHRDWSARIQSVNERRNGLYYRVIRRFFELTGCPIVINTSFNVRGEPIVCTPFDAYKGLHRAELDVLVVGNLLLERKRQPILAASEFESLELD